MQDSIKKEEMKQLIVLIPAKLHSEIKSWAYYRNATLKQYVMEAIIERIKQDTEFNK